MRNEHRNPHDVDGHICSNPLAPPLTHRSGRNFSVSNRCPLFKNSLPDGLRLSLTKLHKSILMIVALNESRVSQV
jgi:hypothetical protein